MTRLIRYSLGLMFAFFSIMSFFMIFIPEAVLVFPGSSWTAEQMAEWRLRTLLPAFYLNNLLFYLSLFFWEKSNLYRLANFNYHFLFHDYPNYQSV